MKSSREKEIDNLEQVVNRNKLKDTCTVSTSEMVQTIISEGIDISKQHPFIFKKN